MGKIETVEVAARPTKALADLFGGEEARRVVDAVTRVTGMLSGGVIWNVNSTAVGGGVAELLHSIVAYTRGAGVDCRWAVISGEPDFFVLTKRLHNALHGQGDGSGFGPEAREIYERTTRSNATELLALIHPGDVAILHDPQTAGLAPLLAGHGVHVIWRCHIGSESPGDASRAGWRFLAPYIERAASCVFTRASYIPETPALEKTRVIAPTIDPFSPKNQPLSEPVRHAILVLAGLLEGPFPEGVSPEFRLADGSLSHVTRAADVVRLGRTCCPSDPLVVQVSRWDRLKDHVGVMGGFARYAERGGRAQLILAGPNVNAVADDPEGAAVFNEVLTAYRALPHAVRARVMLANLPMANANENAVIVNALQRQAAVIVQKSLREGFGLTVTEAMWKGRPVIASRVGGIQDQIEHGVSGLLLDDPADLQTFAELLDSVLSDDAFAKSLGERAHERVRERFLSLRSLYGFANLVCDVLEASR